MRQQPSILVVDDNKDLRNTFALILKRKGYIVETAEDGIEALEKYAAQQFDVVLMDAIMPRMNGIEALHKMQEMNRGAKIILMTAYCEDDQMQKIRQAGAYGALYKPVDIARLMQLLSVITAEPSILVIDDDDDFRSTLSQMLEKQYYRVISAPNGEEGLKIVQTRNINIAFVDIKMKLMDGLVTSIKLKEIRPDITIVLMTGYREEVSSIIESARSRGVLNCLFKPFKINELTAILNQAI